MLLTAHPKNVIGYVLLYGICFTLIVGALGLLGGPKARIFFRPVAAMIFLGYAAYVVTEFLKWRSGAKFGFGEPQSRATLQNAIRGFAVFGLPSLIYLLTGRLGASEDDPLQTESDCDGSPEPSDQGGA